MSAICAHAGHELRPLLDGCFIAISLACAVSQSVRALRLPPRRTHRSLPELVREELSVILLVNEAGTLKATSASARQDHNRNRDQEWCHSAQARKRLMYTFNSAVAGKVVLVNYTYTQCRPEIHGGQSTSRDDANLPGGLLHDISRPGHFVEARTSNKLSFHTKLEDFVLPEFDFSCFADPAGNVMTWSFAEAS